MLSLKHTITNITHKIRAKLKTFQRMVLLRWLRHTGCGRGRGCKNQRGQPSMGLQLCFQCARAFSHICNFSKCLKIPESMMSKRQYHGDFYRIVQFSCSVVSESLRSRGPQHTRLPCPSPTPELAQTHVHPVSDAIQASHPLLSLSPPAFNLSQHQGLFK